LPGFADLDALFGWLAAQRNDLEGPALALVPKIDPATPLPPPRLTRMSGSGATFLALYATLAAAQESADMLSAQHPEWWVRATLLGGPDPS
jgi:4-diphosphocytidyl-2-C-methyl-D-erythritol kinase